MLRRPTLKGFCTDWTPLPAPGSSTYSQGGRDRSPYSSWSPASSAPPGAHRPEKQVCESQGCRDRRTPPAHLLPEQAHLRSMMLFINRKAACFSKKCLGKHSLTQALPAGGRKLLKEPLSGYVCFHGWKLKRTLFFLIH